ncbi:MAG: hypothetical protein CME62_18020 [Halobacteriovoraceae bacterium]|nr:hypothetical protein [Halobacteriovoraceae bacterium]|tara:strand:- start:7178 stop:7375 length:198 start_codon:yes stop_codon:yes gene_type:complete
MALISKKLSKDYKSLKKGLGALEISLPNPYKSAQANTKFQKHYGILFAFRESKEKRNFSGFNNGL